jgi:hypothetical protein
MSLIPDVENRLYGGRALVGFTVEGEYVASWPELTHESLRALNHLTGHGPIPAPTLYRILGELKGIGYLLPQACAQLGRGLEESLHLLDVFDHRRDPGESVAEAVLLLNQALYKATELGGLLEAAQAAIAEQGYRTDDVHPSQFEDQEDR